MFYIFLKFSTFVAFNIFLLTGRETDRNPIAGSFPICLATAKVKNQELNPDAPHHMADKHLDT